MRTVASTVYRLVRFPHQGKIVSIDQLDYCSPTIRFDAPANIPLVNSHAEPKLIGAGLFKDPCLMGVFPPPVPDAFISPINMISSVGTFVGDPWILPSPAEAEQYGDTMPLSPTEKTYSAIQSESVSPSCPPPEDVLDIYSLPEWAAIPSSSSHDFLNDVLLSDEAILEAMTLSERPWEDNHHRSSTLPPLHEEDSPLIATTLSLQSLGSSAPWVVLSQVVSSLPQSHDPVLRASSLNGEILSNHPDQRTKRRGGRCRKRKQHRKAPASGHHAGHHLPSSSTNHTGGRIPISDHHDRKKWLYRAKSSFQAR